MKLAVSNLAWARHDDAAVLALLRDQGVTGIEVAPTKLWPQWAGASVSAARAYRTHLADAGFAVPALQAIMYGKPELQLLDADGAAGLIEHIILVADIAAALGATTLVFGAPKNRQRGSLAMVDAAARAVEVMRRVGALCADRGVCIGWEPNPAEYGCDFITTVAEGRALVDRIASSGVALHLDAAGMHLAGGDIGESIRSAGRFVHYHASEPMLGRFDSPQVDHQTAARALVDVGYDGWISIEMRGYDDEQDALQAALACVRRCYDVV